MTAYKAKFKIGQIEHHKLFDYSGVVFDIDPFFQSSDEWYEQVAQSRPPKNKPWYHILVHTAEHTTYVAEQNLDLEEHPKSIQHPLINSLFAKFDGKQYHLKSKANQEKFIVEFYYEKTISIRVSVLKNYQKKEAQGIKKIFIIIFILVALGYLANLIMQIQS